MQTTENIARFKRALDANRFTMYEDLEFINLIFDKYNFISAAQYARKEGISQQGVPARLKAKNDPFIVLAGKYYIIP